MTPFLNLLRNMLIRIGQFRSFINHAEQVEAIFRLSDPRPGRFQFCSEILAGQVCQLSLLH